MASTKLASGPAERRPYFGVLELELAAMLEQWDIVGVYGKDGMPADPSQRTAQQHEYDDLVRPIIAHLMESDDQTLLASALIAVLRDEYGLTLGDSEEEADASSFASDIVG